ncbi:uncharacterized protein LOC112589401 [Harpegnathos saltator]|uniref:uncharacterized protein LOC112589401 n=1 Tax=Harpegnathos saltator TaxID=610380 RepID=UPI000DBED586|nr:uncharacterized protein LOC112589401 [Harpegnathos saltator]
MGVIIGPSAKDYAEKRDMRRMMVAEKRHREASKEARTARRTAAAAQQQFFEQEEGELYGPGIAEKLHSDVTYLCSSWATFFFYLREITNISNICQYFFVI